ncbi:hypothetical protein CDL12_29139 [Handroanthus impetiginosus]|uniref:Rapid ALkalinization Factor n=1 Tax=Handroanthus impetiginosus TaxID=429701 RepID=A0A2G9FZ86_9LAMI|nr:hypothetical protein CDL12_29139 [Handroanthus impetiginosus]
MSCSENFKPVRGDIYLGTGIESGNGSGGGGRLLDWSGRRPFGRRWLTGGGRGSGRGREREIGRHTFPQLGVALALILVFLSAAFADVAHAPAAVAGFNATRIIDNWLLDDEEFLMESETNRRILQDGKRNPYITYPAVHDPTSTFCNGKLAGSCIGEASKTYRKRNCGYKNLCRSLHCC